MRRMKDPNPRSRYVGLSASEKRKLYRYLSKVREWCGALGGELDVVEEPGKRFVLRCVFPQPMRVRVEAREYVTSNESRYIHVPEKAHFLHLVVSAKRGEEWESVFFRQGSERVRGVNIGFADLASYRGLYTVSASFCPELRVESESAREVDFVLDLDRNEIGVGVIEVS